MTVQTPVSPATGRAGKTGRGVPLQGEGGFDECWYPVALSAEVDTGTVTSKPFLDGRVIVFRGEDGVARVMSPFCRHIGADLAVGTVMGNEVRCAFHHWKYDGTGKCSHIPGIDHIPDTARLYTFHTAEQLGLIWVFNGAEPTYEVPHFPLPEGDLLFRTVAVPEHPVDHWSLISNSVDFMHLRHVHGLDFEAAPETITFEDTGFGYPMAFIDPQLGKMEQQIRVYGTNCITLSATAGELPALSMYAGVPIPGGITRGYTVSGTLNAPGAEEATSQIIDMTETFFHRLIEEDTPIQNSIRFREDHLTEGDKALSRFFAYLRKFPRSHLSQDYIT